MRVRFHANVLVRRKEQKGATERPFREAMRLIPLFMFAATAFAQSPSTFEVGSSRVDLQACKLEYSIVSPK